LAGPASPTWCVARTPAVAAAPALHPRSNDVRALAGLVEDKCATTGVLVTTAWVSAETKAFAARNNRLRIIEGGELKHLLVEHLDLDVRIDLGRPPRRTT
jgi:hypothetical protein